MDKILSLLKSKKFWTLVAAIVAALTAFFTTSCSAQAKVQRHGVHIDTVSTDYIIKSRNIQTAWTNPNEFSLPCTGFTHGATSSHLFETECNFNSMLTIASLPEFSQFSMNLPSSELKQSISKLMISPISTEAISSSSSSTPDSSIPLSLALSVIALPASSVMSIRKRSRRGGRRGGKRPKGTKSIPLGGRHL